MMVHYDGESNLHKPTWIRVKMYTGLFFSARLP